MKLLSLWVLAVFSEFAISIATATSTSSLNNNNALPQQSDSNEAMINLAVFPNNVTFTQNVFIVQVQRWLFGPMKNQQSLYETGFAYARYDIGVDIRIWNLIETKKNNMIQQFRIQSQNIQSQISKQHVLYKQIEMQIKYQDLARLIEKIQIYHVNLAFKYCVMRYQGIPFGETRLAYLSENRKQIEKIWETANAWNEMAAYAEVNAIYARIMGSKQIISYADVNEKVINLNKHDITIEEFASYWMILCEKAKHEYRSKMIEKGFSLHSMFDKKPKQGKKREREDD